MKKSTKLLLFPLVLIAGLLAGAVLFVGSFNADAYRPQVAALLAQKTGRAVRLNGPIALSLGLGGLRLSVRDAALGNPSWASRPDMAGMGKFELGVDLVPLMGRRLSINALSVENADILLEVNAAGERNWVFAPPSAAPQPASEDKKGASAVTTEASLSIDGLSIINSQVAFRGADGTIRRLAVTSLSLTMPRTGAVLAVRGAFDTRPFVLNLKTGIVDWLSREPFSFDADLTVDHLHVAAQGQTNPEAGTAELSAYEVTAGETKITGEGALSWKGARPFLRGTLNSDRLALADFTSSQEAGQESGGNQNAPAKSAAQEAASARVFGDERLPFEALRALDADLAVSVQEFLLGDAVLSELGAKLSLSGGSFVLAPLKATLGEAPVTAQVKLNASQSPAQLSLGVMAKGVDLGDLQRLAAMTPFMTGLASADIQLAGVGSTPHELASTLVGVASVTAEKGQILTGAAASVSSLLSGVFSPTGSDNALNCLAARFIAKGGVLTDNGILIDSSASSVLGNGSVNLGAETVDLTLRARTKIVDVGGLVPSLRIKGALARPSYAVDATGAVKNALGTLINGNGDLGSGVLEVQTPPAGQNACVYTLDHPQKSTSPGVLNGRGLNGAAKKIEDIGNSLVKGLFGQ